MLRNDTDTYTSMPEMAIGISLSHSCLSTGTIIKVASPVDANSIYKLDQ